jgi:regulator of sigma E protease
MSAFASLLQYLVAGLTAISVLVVIHEFGHLLVARFFGVATPVFSVGWGPRLFGFQWKGVDWRVSALPIGGYVLLAGADPFGEEDVWAKVDPEQSFTHKPVWQRFLVMLAGPATNLALPFVVFTVILMLGEPKTDRVIGVVFPNTPADQAGLRSGDRVVSVEGEPIEIWGDFIQALDRASTSPSPDGDVDIEVERGGKTVALGLPNDKLSYTFDGYLDSDAIGFTALLASSRVGVDDPASPAARAGFRTGDWVRKVDGAEVSDLQALRAALSAEGAHTLEVMRLVDGKPLTETLKLEADPNWSPRAGDRGMDRHGFVSTDFFVGRVRPDSPADKAGVKAEDRLWAVDGVVLEAWQDVLRLVRKTANLESGEVRPLTLSVVRNGKIVDLTFSPIVEREVVRGRAQYRPIMGIFQYPDAYATPPTVRKYYGLFEAMGESRRQGWMVFTATLGALGGLARVETWPTEVLSGPAGIFRFAGESAKAGMFEFARFIGTVSFSLGIVNLLPIPVLDGGQIMFYAIEVVRGRPLSVQLREKIQMVGVVGIFALLLAVTLGDCRGIWTSMFG